MLATVLLPTAILLAPTMSAGAADLAFAANFLTGSKQIVAFPVGEPAAMTVVGPQADTFIGMDFDPDASVLWAVNFTTQGIGTVNQATGAYTQTAAIQDFAGLIGFTIDPVYGTFYVSNDSGQVFALNPVTGAKILVFEADTGAVTISAIGVDCEGVLYAADGNVDGGQLYRVDVRVGAPAPVAALPYTRATSLEFDNQSGTLYGWFSDGVDSSTHGVVDTTTANVSQPTVVAGRYRMAIRNTCTAEQLRIFADGFEE